MTTAVRSIKSLTIAAALAFALTVLAVPLTVSASVSPTATIVTGTVTDASDTPLAGASVTVSCNSSVQNDITNAAGDYYVEFDPSSFCPDGASATVTATKGSLSGTNSGKVNDVTTRVNLALVNVQAVPEIGTVAAISAMAVAGGALVYSRRRQMQS